MIKIIVGSENRIKIKAVEETIGGYDFLKGARVQGFEAKSLVSDQPKSLAETITGAQNRAVAAFKNGDLGIGLEDGLIEAPQALTGLINICVCAIYDGKRFHLGTSAGFEYPPKAIELVKNGLDINQAFYKIGLTDDPKIGSAQGAIGILTKGRWQRSDTTKQALAAALIQLDNKELY